MGNCYIPVSTLMVRAITIIRVKMGGRQKEIEKTSAKSCSIFAKFVQSNDCARMKHTLKTQAFEEKHRIVVFLRRIHNRF